MVGAGIGFDPRPGDPLMSSSSNIATSRMLVDCVDIHGVAIGGVKKACLGILGAAQIDKNGNINASKVSATTYIGGAGGSNDIANGANEVVVITKQKKDRFLDKVTYVTCAGTHVTTLISNLGIFEKNGGEFELTHYFSADGSAKDAALKKIVETCGWELKISRQVRAAAEPTAEDLTLLRSLDPEGVFIS
jgi:acyl CoA:acetate/3-ketoacid CoA transferase beta subunit